MVETVREVEEREKSRALLFSRWLLDRIDEAIKKGEKSGEPEIALARISGYVEGGRFRLLQMETARDFGDVLDKYRNKKKDTEEVRDDG